MLAAYFVAVPLFVIGLFVFFRLSPKGRNGVPAYNAGTLLIAFSLSAYYVWKLYEEMAGSADEGWFFVLAPLVVMGITILVLLTSGVLRRYALFRK